MSNAPNQSQPPLTVLPAAGPPVRPRFSLLGLIGRVFFFLILGLSLALNFILLLALLGFGDSFGSESHVTERYYAGQHAAVDKIAVVRMDGVLMDSTIGFMVKELDRAASDSAVKAVVLRINSPGGSISASVSWSCATAIRSKRLRRSRSWFRWAAWRLRVAITLPCLPRL